MGLLLHEHAKVKDLTLGWGWRGPGGVVVLGDDSSWKGLIDHYGWVVLASDKWVLIRNIIEKVSRVCSLSSSIVNHWKLNEGVTLTSSVRWILEILGTHHREKELSANKIHGLSQLPNSPLGVYRGNLSLRNSLLNEWDDVYFVHCEVKIEEPFILPVDIVLCWLLIKLMDWNAKTFDHLDIFLISYLHIFDQLLLVRVGLLRENLYVARGLVNPQDFSYIFFLV